MDLRLDLLLPRFICSACGPITRNKETHEFKTTQDSRQIFQNELGKACFQHDIVFGVFKDLCRRAMSKVLQYYMIKHLILLKIQNILDIKEFLLKILQTPSGSAVMPADKSAIKSKSYAKPTISIRITPVSY